MGRARALASEEEIYGYESDQYLHFWLMKWNQILGGRYFAKIEKQYIEKSDLLNTIYYDSASLNFCV